METTIYILKAIFTKDIMLPFLTAFTGTWFAFRFNAFQIKKVKNNEEIANLNYLIVILHNYLFELNTLHNVIEQQLRAAKNYKKDCEEEGSVPSSIDLDHSIAFSTIKYVKPSTKINITNYSFADKNTSFIISIIKSVRFVEDFCLSLEVVHGLLKKTNESI